MGRSPKECKELQSGAQWDGCERRVKETAGNKNEKRDASTLKSHQEGRKKI